MDRQSENDVKSERSVVPSEEDGKDAKRQGLVVYNKQHLDESHQNLGGAAVEEESPLGREFGSFSVVCLNIAQMVGTGIFSTPGIVLKGTGSVGLALFYWVIGAVIAWAGLAYYLELGAYFPNRAGAEVVYLEQAYKRPRYLFPAAFAASTVILSFSASNCIVFATYIFSAAHFDATEWQEKGLAIGAYTVAAALIVLSTKWSARLSNVLSVVKTALLCFIAITGLVVLGGHTRVADPHANFRNGFQGTTNNGNSLATAMAKISFAYAGWNNAHNVINEVRGGTRTLRWTAPLALGIVFVLYFLANIAFIATIPLAEMKSSGTLVAALFFEKVFGAYAGSRVLPVFVALSAFGNLIGTAIGQARVIREVGRQGVLPWSSFWTSVRPIGTPAAPILLKWALTIIVILACPFGDAFNFVVDLQSYPSLVFTFLNVVGVWLIRSQRRAAGLGRGDYQAWQIALVFSAVVALFLLIMPWVPPATGADGGDVSFWYATYCVVGLGINLACFLYWLAWFHTLPRIQRFTWREEIAVLSNGELSKHFVRDYTARDEASLAEKVIVTEKL